MSKLVHSRDATLIAVGSSDGSGFEAVGNNRGEGVGTGLLNAV